MLKSQEVLMRCAFFIAVTMITLARSYDSGILNVREGKVAHLNFSYPCDSSRVTLRYGYKYPFYSSAIPEAILLPPNHAFENKNDTEGGNCSLHLTINPVLRDDEGTYILTAYKNGQMLPEYPRVGLRVEYLPGKASCETSSEYIDDKWARLICTAPVGTIPGQIICYQKGMRLPLLAEPQETRKTLRQMILAQLHVAYPVYCCSCSLEQSTDMCECKDWEWDPIEKSASTTTTDPCPVTLPTQHLISSQDPNVGLVDRGNSCLLTDIDNLLVTATSNPTPAPKTSFPIICIYVHAGGVTFCVIFIILLGLYICKVWNAKQLSMKCDQKVQMSNV